MQRQMESIRKGAQFLTTTSEFHTAEATRVTSELRKAMDQQQARSYAGTAALSPGR